MADGNAAIDEARARAYATPLDQFQVHTLEHFTSDTLWPWFERLRAEDPVHYTAESEYGPYWSITRFTDIVACESDAATFSSSQVHGGITLFEDDRQRAQIEADPEKFGDADTYIEERSNFIALDAPRHDAQRAVVAPIFSTPSLAELEPLIRERAAKILDELPMGETFDFVEKVSIELTSQMLATLFEFPFEERHLLPRVSDMILSGPAETPEIEMARQAELFSTLTKMANLWDARAGKRGHDLISLLANDPATKAGDDPQKYMGNIILLIVAGSDTTRHSITGGLIALNQHPAEYEKLRRDPGLLPSAVPEIIRWQSPVAYMRRTALKDAEVGGKTIRKGDKIAMWYVSGNRDETAIERAGEFIVDRARPRQHAAFGFGIHRCLGQRLAEMQLRVVWEEMLKRFAFIEVVGEPVRLNSNFVKGYTGLPVRIAAAR